jgi:hypothetical protein
LDRFLREFRLLAEKSGHPDVVAGVVAGMAAWFITSALRSFFG